MPAPSTRRVPALLMLLAGAVASPEAAQAAAGSLDPAFGGTGTVVTTIPDGFAEAFSVAVQPDGKIVVGGTHLIYGSPTSYDFGVLRYLPDGTLDPSFGSDGIVGTDFGLNHQEAGKGMALQADGKIVVAGRSFSSAAIARYLGDGTLDPAFGTGGLVKTQTAPFTSHEIESVIVQADGKIVVAGSAGGITLIRYHSDGTLDTTFAGDGSTTIQFYPSGSEWGMDVALQADGKYVVTGGACPPGSPCTIALERFNVDGSLDATFGVGGLATAAASDDDEGIAVAIQADGKIVVLGRSGFPGDFVLARFLSDGSLDMGFGTAGLVATDFGGRYDVGAALTIQGDGSLISVGRALDQATSTSSFALTRHDASGQIDPTFGSGGKLTTSFGGGIAEAQALAVDGAGRLLLAGRHDPNGGSVALARYWLQDNTPAGSGVVAAPVDETTGGSPVTLTFGDVSEAGDTTLATSTTGPDEPEGFRLGSPATFYEISTTAVFDSAEVCIHYAGVSYRNEAQLKLFHFEDGAWADVTTSHDRDADVICGIVTSLSPFAIFEASCTVPGDVEPDGVGDGDVDLADVALARRKARGAVPVNDHDLLCGDVHPGVMTCARPRSQRSWCPEGDGDLDRDDVRVLHDLATGAGSGCEGCAAQVIPSARRVPGDIAPTGATNGVVDIGDVVRALRLSTALDPGDAETRLRADVAPSRREDGIVVAGGDGRITIGDVVLLLRASVGLDSLAWPERHLLVTVAGARGDSWSVSTSAWPPWAPVSEVSAGTCPQADVLVDLGEDGWSVACVTAGAIVPPTIDLAVVTYRAPEAVPLADVRARALLVGSDLATRDEPVQLSPL